jgi:FMN phosphatase YigB (HAD superfamily)
MITPKVVVFDLGKVLLDFDYSIAIRHLAGRCKAPVPDIQSALSLSPLLAQYETGLISTPDFFGQICKAVEFEGSLDEFASIFGDIFTEIAPMIQLHERLWKAGVPTYILSNTNDLAVRHIRAAYPFFSRFNGYVLSYEHRCMKPDEPIYRILERLAKHEGEDLFYIDDRAENVDAAKRLGWQGIVHHQPEATLACVRNVGLPV